LVTFPHRIDNKKNEHLTLKDRLKKKEDQIKNKRSKNEKTVITNDELNINNNNARINRVIEKSKLPTIDETTDQIDSSFDFLDQISVNSNMDDDTFYQQSEADTNQVQHSNPTTTTTTTKNEVADENKIVTKKMIKNSNIILHKLKIIKLKLIGFLKTLKKLFTNLRYTLLILVISAEYMLVTVFADYMIMYAQHVYQLTSSRASIIVGGILIPGAITGAIAGGLIIKKFKLYIEGCTRMIIVASIVVICGIFGLIFVRCDGPVTSGIDTHSQTYLFHFYFKFECFFSIFPNFF
jgi:membrane-associated HD superfamily phosphohydrolase